MKTVDGSKYSVHASSILESHDEPEPTAATQSAAASAQVSYYRPTFIYPILSPPVDCILAMMSVWG